MTELLRSYTLFFIHPFKSQAQLAAERDLKDQSTAVPYTPSLFDFLCVSWALSCLKGIYALLGMLMGLKSWSWPKDDGSIVAKVLGPQGFDANKMLIFFILLAVVLFPLGAFVFVKFWGLLVRFFIRLYEIELREEEKAVDEVVAGALTSHMFFVVPIFGEIAKHISSLVFLFAGLRSNLRMSVLQALMVVISPLFIVFFAFLVLGLYLALVFTAI